MPANLPIHQLEPVLSRQFVVLLTLALLLRLIVIVAFPSLHHPDEDYQFLEQAHRLAFGYGIRTWEFRDGIRSLLGPAVFARLFALVASSGGGPRSYILAIRLSLALVSVGAVAAVYRASLPESRTHALIAGGVTAAWFELVYFAGRPLTEAMATTFLIVALSLASAPRAQLSARRLVAIGFFAGLCAMLRVHLAVGLLVLVVSVGRADFRSRWLPMIAGAIVPIVLFGVADWIAWGSPFHSQLEAFRINVLQNKASLYGAKPRYWYAVQLFQIWGVAAPVILALAATRLRKSLLWLLVAAAIVASHSLIPHKEYRFVFPAYACIVIVAAWGSADLVLRLRQRFGSARTRALPAVALSLWIAVSAALACSPAYADNWFRGRDLIQQFFWLAAQPDVCGLLIYDYAWVHSGGYAYLHHDVPIYPAPSPQDPALQAATAFNYVILKRSSLVEFDASRFALQHCIGQGDAEDMCIARRTGECTFDRSLHPLLLETRLGEKSVTSRDQELDQ
jgi:GPI mannosyltransferase 3